MIFEPNRDMLLQNLIVLMNRVINRFDSLVEFLENRGFVEHKTLELMEQEKEELDQTYVAVMAENYIEKKQEKMNEEIKETLKSMKEEQCFKA